MEQQSFSGLNDEAVLNNRKQFGTNAVASNDNHRIWHVIKEIVTEPIFIILVVAAFIYFLLGEYNEGIIMLVAIFFVSGISLYQENKSRNAVDELKKLSAPRAKVFRNGIKTEITSEEIVINDLIAVEDGNIIPADAVILKANDFSVNESILTGESLPVFKDVNEPDNKLFQGTLVMTGSCIAKVTAIGQQTSMGKIGQSLQEIETEKTPLQLQIKSFVRSMIGIGIVAFLIVVAVNYFITKNLLHGLLHGLTLAMSLLPEEIPVAFSTFMALGAYHLYKKKVIARSPHTVETLGAATVICVDKTGTITENQMQLSAVYNFQENKIYDYKTETPAFNSVIETAMWASESDPFDAMEKAIHAAYGITAMDDLRKQFMMIHEYPLSGQPPMMTHVFSNKNDLKIIACKGGVESVLNQCNMSPEEKTNINDITHQLASKGNRVLAVAKVSSDLKVLPASQHDFRFTFIGLIAFYDPPKNNMTDIMQKFYAAGVKVKMITGDYAETAVAIARQINFANSASVLTGTDVMNMNDDELKRKVETTDVFARMFPDAKLKVIEALKQNNEVVAMTGDGVNDGPALKAAHIGVAMGLRGSELAKKAASLILMDDDLTHMVDAIALGRRIYENLKKAIQYIISIHIPIVLIVTLPLLLFWKFSDFFSPIHVIFLELIMGPTCSIIFENEPIEANSMNKPPRKMSNTFFSLRELSLSIVQGLCITAACLGMGYYFMVQGHEQNVVRTIIYTTLIFSNLFLTLVNRSFYYSIFTTIQYKNNLIPLILIISLIVLFLSIYFNPVRTIFDFVQLPAADILLCFIAAIVGVVWIEGYKFVKRKAGQQK